MSPGSSSHSSLGSKSAQHLQRHVVAQRAPLDAADAPAPPARDLQQEHVVRIDVRADAAAVAGVRDHHVVEARVGHEAEAPQQPCAASTCRSTPCTSSVQSGVASGGNARRAQRPVAQRPARAVARDQPRLDVIARGQREQLGARRAGGASAQRGAHQQRLLLPVPAHERAGDRPPSRGASAVVDVHAAIIVRSSFDGNRRPLRRQPDLAPRRCARQPIDELSEPVEFFFGGDDLLAKVEEALAGQDAGFETTLHLEPEHAFGDYDPELVFFEDRAIFPAAASSPACSSTACPRARKPRHAGGRDLHRDRGLPGARRARRQPSARRHRAAPRARRARRARGHRRRDRSRQRRQHGLSVLAAPSPGPHLH